MANAGALQPEQLHGAERSHRERRGQSVPQLPERRGCHGGSRHQKLQVLGVVAESCPHR